MAKAETDIPQPSAIEPEWGEGLRVLWLVNDFAMGGIARYTHSLAKILKGSEIAMHVVYCVDFLNDEKLMATIDAPLEKWSLQRYVDLASSADLITGAGIQHFTPNHKTMLEIAGDKYIGQLHGMCDYTKGLLSLQSQFTRTFICVAQPVADLAPSDIETRVLLTPFEFDNCVRRRAKSEAKAALGIPPGTRVVSYGGRIAPDKGLLKMAEAIKQLPEDVMFLVVGNGYAEKEILPKLTETLGTRLIFRPWTDSPSYWLDPADCFICMSDFEGGPLTVLEAMAHGTPVISLPVGIVPTLNDGSPCAVTYTMPSDILAATQTPWHRLQRISTYVQDRFSHDKVVSDWTTFIRDTIDARQSGKVVQ